MQRVLLLAVVLVAACYAPELRECSVVCDTSARCAPGQVCGKDGWCATEAMAGRCATQLHPDADSPFPDASPDDAKAHGKFVAKYQLNFPLLIDPEKKLLEAFGVWAEKSMYGRTYMGVLRATFVVGADGKVEKVWPKVKPEGHGAEVLAWLKG